MQTLQYGMYCLHLQNPKHDASYKNFFTHPRTVADTLRAAAGGIARHLDFATLERMPASFVTEHLGQRRWTAATDIGDLLGPVPGEPLGYLPRLRYLLIDCEREERRKER